jgi:DNA-binding beta-propeller fold protein YncE
MNPYDPERHLWLVDDGANTIYEFSNDGKKLLRTLGEFKVAGWDKTHFSGPTGISFASNGDMFITDGYGNSRVVKYSKDGKYLMEWGEPGRKPGEFAAPHGIAIDARGRLYIVDRANSRVQVFDANGKFLDQWPNIPKPCGLGISQDQQSVWVADCYTQKILKYDLNGKLLYSWGSFGAFPGGFWCIHQIATDSDGNLYTADVYSGRPQKFRPKKGADPSKLIGNFFTAPRPRG